MIEVLYVALVVFLAANPPAASRFWVRTSRVSIGVNRLLWTVAVAGVALIISLIAVISAEAVVDLFGVSLPTFQIGAGALLLLGTIPAFIPDRDESDNLAGSILWPALRLLLWLASPSVLFALVAMSADLGRSVTALGTVLAVALSALVLVVAVRYEGTAWSRVVVWLGWLLAAALIVLAADLIRQGVQTV